MNFANSIWFWSALMVMIPIVIHFFSNKKVEKIYVGSLQLLNETLIKKSKKIAIQDIPLLIVRALLLILLTLILSGPFLVESSGEGESYFISAVELTPQYKMNMENDGFKVLGRDSISTTPFSNEWNFLMEFDRLNSKVDSLVYIVDDSVEKFFGRAPKLSFPYTIINRSGGGFKKKTDDAIIISYTIELSDSLSRINLTGLLNFLNNEQKAYVFEECLECDQKDLLITDKQGDTNSILKILASDNLSIKNKSIISKIFSNEVVISSDLLKERAYLESFMFPFIETIEEHFNPYYLVNQSEIIEQKAYIEANRRDQKSSLKLYLWLLFVLLFLLERAMVFRRNV